MLFVYLYVLHCHLHIASCIRASFNLAAFKLQIKGEGSSVGVGGRELSDNPSSVLTDVELEQTIDLGFFNMLTGAPCFTNQVLGFGDI